MKEQKQTNSKRLMLRLPQTLLERLKEYTETNDINYSQMLRKLLNNHLN